MSSSPPDGIDLARHRDLSGRHGYAWTRRAGVLVLALFVGLGLLNVFGQRPTTSAVAGSGAQLTVYAPTRVRGGDLFAARLRIDAASDLRAPTLVLDDGWFEGMTFNGIAPQPARESGRASQVRLGYGPLNAGESLVVWISFQVNPTNVGRRSQSVSLLDGERVLAHADRTVTVFP